ncbi:MAG: DUF1343 domain-containing protein [Chloroflexi bacterium]|nr:DUF1343 domain-containing protein [Chloroflexota bacterium]
MVKTGLDILLHKKLSRLRGKRVGVVTHPAAVLPDFTSSVDALLKAKVNLTALYGPEHGISGAAAEGAKIGNVTDSRSGLPVFSLYGETREPNEEMLRDVDVLLLDMQDVGVRFYTYISTLFYLLKGAAKNQKEVIVLDRPNPITGTRVEGRLIDAGFESFIGIIPIPIRHGMTLGELAHYMNTVYKIGAKLDVITMQGWKRAMWFDDTGLPWVATSPAIPHFATTIMYPGVCLLEGINVSVGRGTSLPFEICGAPWVDGNDLAETMNGLKIKGVRFRAINFQPSGNKYANEPCGGVQVHVTDREAASPLIVGLELVKTIRALYPSQFQWNVRHFDILSGSSRARQSIEANESAQAIYKTWQTAAAKFKRERKKFLFYS